MTSPPDESNWLVEVWDDNFEAELARISEIIEHYPYIGMVLYLFLFIS